MQEGMFVSESVTQRGDEAPDAVLRLASSGQGEAFLAAHQVEAARRLALLFVRARLTQRMTMSYDPARIGGSRDGSRQGELADSALQARRLLDGLAGKMPRDCWSILVDICGFDKGLQEIEMERGWPRRSAKLVLRIGLDQLATVMGLSEFAEGKADRKLKGWLPERPPLFPDPAT
jgi:hypothetical protein